MANSLLDLREICPKPLSSEVHFCLALAVWQCVNEEPPLVPFERQSLSCAGIQRQPPWPRSTNLSSLKFPPIAAKLRAASASYRDNLGVRVGRATDHSGAKLESQSLFDLFR